eukprot:gnl/Hemi2/2532_TR897_c0_g1_i1.p1 gnl/Hemi2/2532_TR897_c0_g1~~gnl/Hemi2/2532_TR897_c0_g1_i1.p1  ORF type:complete len:789 (+),score=265.02 gnl/Hemi2/2532_TR897_c0_g1_i1:100-2466(+)
MSGPQADRSRSQLSGASTVSAASQQRIRYEGPQRGAQPDSREADLVGPMSRRSVVYTQRGEEFDGQVQALQAENAMLKDQVRRQNVEIRRYQDRVGVLPTADAGTGALEPWLANPSIMSPLFLAYDERLKERERDLNQHKNNLSQLKPDMEALVAENEQLRSTRVAQADFSAARASTLRSSVKIMPDEWRDMEERNDLLQQESELLQEQLSRAQSELERLRQETSMKTGDFLRLNQEYGKQSNNLKEVTEDRDLLDKELRKLRKQLSGVSGDLDQCQTERLRLIEDLKTTETRLKNSERIGTEYKRKFEELSVRSTGERDVILRETTRCLSKEKAATEMAIDVERELDDTKQRLVFACKDLDACKAECETLMKAIQGMDQRVAESQAAEIASASALRKAQDHIEELKLSLDQAQVRENFTAKECERLGQKLQTQQADTRAVYESEISSIRAQCNASISAAKEQTQRLELEVIRLKGNLEKSEREKRAQEDQLSHISKIGPSEVARSANIVEELQGKLTAAESRRDQALQEGESLQLSLKRTQTEFSEKEAQHHVEMQEALRKQRRMEREHDDLLAHSQSLTAQNDQYQKTVRELRKERDEATKKILGMESFLQKKYDAKVADLEARLHEASDNYARACKEVEQLLAQQDRIGLKWREETKVSVLKLERVMNDLRAENERLLMRNEELNSRLEECLYERAGLNEERDANRKALFNVRQMLDSSQKQAADAGAQVASLMARELENMKEKKDLLAKIDLLAVDVQRSERARAIVQRQLNPIFTTRGEDVPV